MFYDSVYPVTFTVNNPYNIDYISSYEWLIDTSGQRWLFDNQPALPKITTTSPTLTLTPACGLGARSLKVIVNFSGTDYKDTTEVATVNVKEPVFTTTVPTEVCGPVTYQINKVPAGATVQWSTANGVLSLQSGQGTATAVFAPNGSGRENITANISYQCYLFTISFNDISVGVPANNLINVTAGNYDNGTGTYSLCTDMPNDVTAAYFKRGTILEWEWQTSNYDWEISEHPTGGLPEQWGQNHVIRLRALQGQNSSSPVNLYVRARNNCGWGDWKAMQYQVKSCYNYYLSPNPAVNYFDIMPQNADTTDSSITKSATPLFDKVIIKDSASNKIVRQQNLNRSANSQRIDVKRLSGGVYIVELYINGTLIEQQPLIIKK